MKAMAARQTAAVARTRTRLWKSMALLALLAGWLYLFLAGDGGWLELRAQRQRLAGLEKEVARLAATNDSLNRVVERMAQDPAFLEKVARERLGMVRPGESVYRMHWPGAAAAAR